MAVRANQSAITYCAKTEFHPARSVRQTHESKHNGNESNYAGAHHVLYCYIADLRIR